MKLLKFFLWLFISLTLITGGTAFAIWYYVYHTPAVEVFSEPQQFIIKRDDNLKSVVNRLTEEVGLKHPKIFYFIADKMNIDNNLRPGKIKIQSQINTRELAVLLRKSGTYTVNVTIRGSQDIKNIPQQLSDYLEPTKEEFDSLLTSNEYLSQFGFNKKTIAAMFVPNTYNMYWFTTAEEVIARFYKEYQQFWNADRKAKANAIGLEPLEVATLASIIDKETNQVEEMQRIAGVYINRLKQGWKLQADPTVKYAMDSMTLTRILTVHTLIESPYNTYYVEGLPPNPICIPSTQSQDAVLNFEKHKYMYFCAKPDFSGFHVFASTLNEHNRNASAYHRFLNSLKK